MTASPPTPPREVISEILRDMLSPKEFRETIGIPSTLLFNLYPQEFDYNYQIRVARVKLQSLTRDHIESKLLGTPEGASDLQKWIQASNHKDSYPSLLRSVEHLSNLKNKPSSQFKSQLNHFSWLDPKVTGISDEEKETFEFAGRRITGYYFLAPYVMFQESRMTPFVISQSNWNILGLHYRKLSQLYPGYLARVKLEG